MLSHLPFDKRQKAYAFPSHKDSNYGYKHKHNIQAKTSSCQRVINDDSLHIRPNSNSEDTHYPYHLIFEETHDINHQLFGSLDHFQSSGSLDHFQLLALEYDLIDFFLHLPMLENIPFIFTYANIAQAQPGDAQLQILRAQKPNQYIQKLLVPNLSLWWYQKAHNQPWRIYLPHALLEHAVKWYHHALSHVSQA
jgi:hypothetical protein